MGSVYLRGRMWTAQLSMGSGPSRRYRRRSATQAGHPNTRRGAIAALEELRAEHRSGLNLSAQTQELLRHATSRLTMDVYSHVSSGQRREAVEALERALGGVG